MADLPDLAIDVMPVAMAGGGQGEALLKNQDRPSLRRHAGDLLDEVDGQGIGEFLALAGRNGRLDDHHKVDDK